LLLLCQVASFLSAVAALWCASFLRVRCRVASVVKAVLAEHVCTSLKEVVCLLAVFSGQLITIFLTVMNTGSRLDIHGILLNANAEAVSEGLQCRLLSHPDGPQPFTLDTFSVLAPGAVVNCTNKYRVTAADLESGDRTWHVNVTGTAEGGQIASDFSIVPIKVASRLVLAVKVLEDQCDKPTTPGEALTAAVS
jgi:hypothetical protein